MKVAFLVMLLQIKSTAMKIFLGAESGDSRMASTALEQGAKLAKRTADAGAAAEVEDVVGHIDDSDDELTAKYKAEVEAEWKKWKRETQTQEANVHAYMKR